MLFYRQWVGFSESPLLHLHQNLAARDLWIIVYPTQSKGAKYLPQSSGRVPCGRATRKWRAFGGGDFCYTTIKQLTGFALLNFINNLLIIFPLY